ncbi:thiamine-phosphate kinase [Alistipes sp. OttesenSCG-928-L06]|nr:thiamine-phosphate kinase [Alistipes sp. OttesenSCG-928-L06]
MYTDTATIGEFGLIDRITQPFALKHPQSLKGPGDDAAVIDNGKNLTLVSTDLLLEGIHFDLIYTPLTHLGYKTVVAGISDIYAMNGTPRQITVSIGVSVRFGVEQIEELYKGVKIACDKYNVDLVGGDTSASLTGLTLSVTAIGEVEKDKIVYRSGAKNNELICVTGDLGSAYLGLKLLDREKRVLDGVENPQPRFDGFEYLLQRQLKPDAQKLAVESMAQNKIVPSAMIDLSDGLASDLLQICKASKMGACIYLDRLPIAKESFALAEELHIDPVVAALNGGDDYELLFTVPLDRQGDVAHIPGAEIIGHIVPESKGCALTTPDGQEISITAPGWGNTEL